MTATNLFHFGVLVFDLDRAIDRFSDILGLHFNQPSTVHFDRLADPAEHEFDLRVSYSREGPPHMELIEAVGQGIYSPSLGEGIHHVGTWVPDVAENISNFEGPKSMIADARVLTPEGTTRTWYSSPDSAHGVRLEFVDAKRRAAIEQWIRGESPNADGRLE